MLGQSTFGARRGCPVGVRTFREGLWPCRRSHVSSRRGH